MQARIRQATEQMSCLLLQAKSFSRIPNAALHDKDSQYTVVDCACEAGPHYG